MKKSNFRVCTLSIVSILCVSISLTTVVADPYSTQIALPEGAKARLGKGGINAIAYSPDSTRLAVSSDLGIWMYDTDSGEELGLFVARRPHLDAHAAPASIGDIAFSPDGNMIATAGYDDVIRLWDALTGEQKAILTGHESSVSCIAFSPDGRTLASGGGYDDKTVRLWNINNYQQKAILTGHESSVTCIAFSPDGRTLASGGGYGDKTIRLWDIDKHQQKVILTGHQSSICCIAFSPDGRTLASGGGYDEHKPVRLWDVSTGQEKKALTGLHANVYGIAFSPDGKTLACGSREGYVSLWDTFNWIQKGVLRHPDDIKDIAFSPDGNTLTLASGTEVQLWDAVKGTPKIRLTKRPDAPLSAAFSADGNTLACGNRDGTVRFWNIETQQPITTLPPPPLLPYKSWGWHPWRVESVAFSPNGKVLATVGNTQIYLWECISNGAGWCQKAILTGHTSSVSSVAFSPDGSLIASGSGDQTIRIYDARNGQHKMTLTGHTRYVSSVAFNLDGRTLASGSYDGTVRLWDVVTGEGKITLTGHNPSVTGVAFSPDGKTLASSGSWRDKSVRLWDVSTGMHKRTFTHTDDLESVVFSPDGNTLAGGSRDGTIFLWDPHTETLKRKLRGHTLSVSSLTFSPDGRTLASTSYDGTVLLWEAAPTVETVPLAPRTEIPTEKPTALLPNYPNPFNPETWIPYQLADAADVTVRIYAVNGILIRTLALGHQLAGAYQNRRLAAYWDGKNEIGEPVASGLYFYTLSAGRFTATRKMLIRK